MEGDDVKPEQDNRLTHDSPEAMLGRMAIEQVQAELKLLNEKLWQLRAGSRICPGCFNKGEFGRNLSRPDGKQVYCKQCRSRKEGKGVHNN